LKCPLLVKATIAAQHGDDAMGHNRLQAAYVSSMDLTAAKQNIGHL
jgi:hypothetical protein